MYTPDEIKLAQRVVSTAVIMRSEIEREAILAGCVPADVADRIMADETLMAKVVIGKSDSGKDVVRGADSAVAAWASANRDLVTPLPALARNEKLPLTVRFGEAYKAVLKRRSSVAQTERQTQASLEINSGRSRYIRASNLNAPYRGPRASRRKNG